MEVLLAAKAADRSTQVILMTAFASTDTAIAAMKEGAADYITKPFKIDELTVQVAKALDVRQLERENTFLKKQLATSRKGVGLVGTSEAMRRVNEMVARVAPAKPPCSSRERAVPARRCSLGPSMRRATVPPAPSSPSTAAPSPRASSRANSSATPKEPSRAPPGGQGALLRSGGWHHLPR